MCEYKSYDTDLKGLKDTLLRYGVAVIPNVLNAGELEHMRAGCWDVLETITQKFSQPIQRNDQKSWSSFYQLMPIHSMLLQHYGVGHAQFVWDVRQNPRVHQVFSDIWQTPELLVSYDGLSVHLPPEVTGRGWYLGNNWLHTDQSYTRNDFECVQGFVTGYDINEGDASLTILEGSHQIHIDVAKEFKITDTADWYKLNEEQLKYYKSRGCDQKVVKCRAGSLVLWDSRTIHAGREPERTRSAPNFRLVVYVCMTPKKWCRPDRLKRHIEIFEQGRMTTHWPHKPKMFGLNPRTYGRPMPTTCPLPSPILSPSGRQLVGYDPKPMVKLVLKKKASASASSSAFSSASST